MSDEDVMKFLQRISWFGRTDEPPMVSSPMYERFTDRSRKVMQLAQQEADRLNHEYVGTEHILIGLLKEGSGVAANVLKNLDMDLHKIRQEVENILMPGPDEGRLSGLTALAKKPITPRGKKVLEHAIEAARTLVHNYVGTEHLLLGLLNVEEGVACQVLNNLGLKLEDVREEVLNLLGHPLEKDEGVYGLAPPKEKVAEWKLEVEVPASAKTMLAEIERIVNFEADPAKAVSEIKKLFIGK